MASDHLRKRIKMVIITNILETKNLENIEAYLLAIDFKKGFAFLNHSLLIAVLEKYGFGHDCVDWIKVLLKNQKSCVMNCGHTTHYFNLERDTHQGNPISVHLFILDLENLFILNKSNKNIHGIKIFKHKYNYTAYADDTTFLKKDISSVKIVFTLIDSFPKFSGLCPNVTKCEIAGIGVLKNINVELCDMKNVSLTKETIKTLDIHISYNKIIQDDLNFRDSIKNIANVIRPWPIRKLTLESGITILKSLAISKILYVALLTTIPNSVIEELKQIKKMF